MKRADITQIIKDVQINHTMLERCVGPHDFQPLGDRKFAAHYVCDLCGGRVSARDASMYNKGMAHARLRG